MTKKVVTLIITLMLSINIFANERSDTAWQMVKEGALVIDVRTDQEYVSGHLEDAILIPHPRVVDLFAKLEIRKDRRVVLYCRSGNRAGIAEAALRKAGYTRLFNGGGYTTLINDKPPSQQ